MWFDTKYCVSTEEREYRCEAAALATDCSRREDGERLPYRRKKVHEKCVEKSKPKETIGERETV